VLIAAGTRAGSTNWTEWAALAAWATVVVYVVIGAVAWRQVKEARRLREEQARPWVVAYFEASGSSAVHIVIENTGTTVARDVKVAFDPLLTSTLLRFDPLTIPALAEGISMLPPRHRLIFDFDWYMQREKERLPMRFAVTVAYKGADGKTPLSTTYDLDLRSLTGSRLPAPGLPDVAKALDSISYTLRAMNRMGTWNPIRPPMASPPTEPVPPDGANGKRSRRSRLRDALRVLGGGSGPSTGTG
jgi:hypothetical protein